MSRTLKFELSVDYEIDGEATDDVVAGKITDTILQNIPSVVCEGDDLMGYAIIINSMECKTS